MNVPPAGNTDGAWRFGVYQIGDRSGELRRGGTLVKLREQSFRILLHLVERAGEVVSREDLRRVLWPVETFVDFEHSLNAAVMRLREALGDAAESPLYIETIPRRGYRFVAPVMRVIEGTSAEMAVGVSAVPGRTSTSVIPAPIHEAGTGTAFASSAPESKSAWKPAGHSCVDEAFSIAVLPFNWTGTDAHLASCADGATEAIIAGLSRFSYLQVMAASSIAQSGGKPADAGNVQAASRARYLVEGSLRQAGSRVRASVHLVDCASGAHLWAETYDRDLSSCAEFGLLDDIVPQIVSTIADGYGVLSRSMHETLRLADPNQLSPYEAVLLCFAYFMRLNGEEYLPVRTALERTVVQVPGYADAWALLSLMYVEEITRGHNVVAESVNRALVAARRAVALSPTNHLAHHALAVAEFFAKEYQRFRLAAARALELNPMDGFTLAYLGALIAYSGDWKRGGVLSASARRLNPHHPGWYWIVPGLDAYRGGDYRAALEFAYRANMPGFWRTHLLVAASLGQLGDRTSAAEALDALLEQRPDLATAPREGLSIWWQPEMVEHLVAGLSKAGLADAMA